MFRFALPFCLALAAPVVASEYRFSDAHLHYVDFFQESDGITRLVKAMDEAGIDHAMISGISVAKKWHEDEPKRPRYYAGDDAGAYWFSATDVFVHDAVTSLPEEQQKRFHPFLTGFNPTDKNADAHIRRMLELHPGFWQGIGEIFTRHDDLTALTYGDTPRANNEALARVYHLAAEYDLPVMVHSNITSKRERNPLYLEEIEEPLRNHPHVRFIWAHAGTSMEIHRHQEKLDFLLQTVTRLLAFMPLLGYLTEFDGKSFVDVARGDLDLGKLDTEEDKKAQEEVAKAKEGLVERLKQVLGEQVAEVRVSHRLTDSPAILAIGEQDLGLQMRQILEASGQKVPESKPIFEINPEHPLIEKLDAEPDEDRFGDLTHILFDQAALAAGDSLKDPAAYVQRLNKLLVEMSA